ncbi:hypothetical protein JGF74_26410, partial [Salmonella enterica subsp. enterica serovar Typhimurium]|nr:hypothetical protein [Salmonella enterica subsp. enterica serovar Typhimurium]
MSQNGLRFTLDVDGLTPTATAVVGFPSSGINSSTGASWNKNERLKTPDDASNDSIKSGHGSQEEILPSYLYLIRSFLMKIGLSIKQKIFLTAKSHLFLHLQ